MRSRVVVVGGGPHGLAVLAALAARPEPWPESVAVVDPHDGWAQAWDDKLERLRIDRLRSPQVHHPGPRPMQLRDLIEARPSGQQLALRRPEAERVPTPAGMRTLVDELAAGLGPVEWITGRATAIELPRAGHEPAPRAIESPAGDDGPAPPANEPAGAGAEPVPPAIVRLAGGRPLHADWVVLAHNPSTPRIPDWAQPLVASGTARHASTVDLRAEPLAGRHVAVVGGGLTAACLALEATRGGAHVTLLSRRALRARPYDVDASWLGPRRLDDYRRRTAAERRALIDLARDGGSIPPRTLDELRAAAADPGSGLVIREAVDVAAELRSLLTPVDDEACAASASAPTDTVWLATGFANDVTTDPLVGPLLTAGPVAVHGGLPAVTDDLRLPETPVFVTGPYAALAVGPASRNLAGARPAAARIAAAIAGAAPAGEPSTRSHSADGQREPG